jgi:hypothetical protein
MEMWEFSQDYLIQQTCGFKDKEDTLRQEMELQIQIPKNLRF